MVEQEYESAELFMRYFGLNTKPFRSMTSCELIPDKTPQEFGFGVELSLKIFVTGRTQCLEKGDYFSAPILESAEGWRLGNS